MAANSSKLLKRIFKPSFITLVVLIFIVFIVVRLINLNTSYVWYDDTASVGPLSITSFQLLMQYGMREITGPIIPTIIYWVIVRLAGPDLNLLHLVPLLTAVLSLYLFYRFVLCKVLKSKVAILGVLLTACFSIPMLLYSQALEPAIFYFLSGVILGAVFIRLFITKPLPEDPLKLVKSIAIFSLVALAVFFINYMSVLVYFTLLGCLFLYLLGRIGRHMDKLKGLLLLGIATMVVSLPLLLFINLRMHSGETNIRTYFVGFYYISQPWDAFKLGYDALTYIFNFSYLPKLYSPLSLNLLSLPFVLIVCLGAASVWSRLKGKILIALFLYSTVLFLGLCKIVPIGGVRHVLSIAPFIFLAFGFGLEYLEALFKDGNKRSRIWKYLRILLLLVAPILFLFTGLNFYSDRSYLLDPAKIAAAAKQYGVKTVLETDFVGPLAYYDQQQGSPLAKDGIKIAYLDEYACPKPDQDYLLANYRYKLDPNWPFSIIPSEDDCLKHFQVIPLWEDPGKLSPDALIQSIYFPVNGNFVYLLQPR